MRKAIYLIIFTSILSLHAQRSDFDNINFWKAEYLASQHKGEDLHNLPLLVHGLTATLQTDAERFRAIYYWVCHNITGDFKLMRKTDRKHKEFQHSPEALAQWNRDFKKEVFKRLRSEKVTLCTGYAYLIKELAHLAGIESEIIHGYGAMGKVKIENMKMPNHSWNAVKLNGKWYLCDATWSSGIIDLTTLWFEPIYDDRFFLMEPSEFAKTHKPLKDEWTLLDDTPNN